MLKEPPGMTPYLGKNISTICSRSIVRKPKENHCAHFVSHMMEYENFPHTCKNQSLADKDMKEKGAAIRVNELFNVADTGHWSDLPRGLTSCLIFVTRSGNLSEHGGVLTMGDKPHKHVGIYQDGVVWHHGPTRVERTQEKVFITQFTHTYIVAGNTIQFFYARFLE